MDPEQNNGHFCFSQKVSVFFLFFWRGGGGRRGCPLDASPSLLGELRKLLGQLTSAWLFVIQFVQEKTRSSAQCNCSAKSLAANVVDSSLSSLSSMGGGGSGGGGLGVGGVWGWGVLRWGVQAGPGGLGEGEGLRGKGAGDISSTLPYTALPHGASS